MYHTSISCAEPDLRRRVVEWCYDWRRLVTLFEIIVRDVAWMDSGDRQHERANWRGVKMNTDTDQSEPLHDQWTLLGFTRSCSNMSFYEWVMMDHVKFVLFKIARIFPSLPISVCLVMGTRLNGCSSYDVQFDRSVVTGKLLFCIVVLIY